MRISKLTAFVAAAAAAAFVLPSFASAESNGDEGSVRYDLPIDGTTGGSPISTGTFSAVPHDGGAPQTFSYDTVSVGPTTSLRVNWEVPMSVGPNPVLFQIDWLGAPGSTANPYDVINVNYNGRAATAGSDPSNDSNIPWNGEYGTNHQYINHGGPSTDGAWNETGPGPHAPESSAMNALGDNGVYVWLKGGSELYVGSPDNGDFNGHNVTEVWSDLVIEQVPEPTALSLLGLAAGGLVLRRRRTA